MRVAEGSSRQHIDFYDEQHGACSLGIGSDGNGLRQNCAIGRIERSADQSSQVNRPATDAPTATSKRSGKVLAVDLD